MITLLEDLKSLHSQKQVPDNWNVDGICVHLQYYNKDEFKMLATSWPKYSGDSDYPVPGYYFIGANTEDESQRMWDREVSDYAALRWELLEWCIEKLEN